MKKEKIAWVNVLKFLGIFAIYLGHFQESAGKFYQYVFSYHVPLFFFVAGFFDDIHEMSFRDYFIKNIKKLMIPYFILSFIYIIISVLLGNFSLDDTINMTFNVFLGIKNKIPAVSLWFIPCLFCMKIVNFFVLKFVNKIKYKKSFHLIIAMIFLYLRYFVFLKIGLATEPKLIWCFDGIFEYYIYFVIGKYLFKYLNTVLFNFRQNSLKKKIFSISLFLFCLIFSILVYYYELNCYKISNNYLFILCIVGKALILIIYNSYLAYFFSRIKFFSKIGEDTLYLCGTEKLIKKIMESILGILGISLNFKYPIITILYVGFLILIDSYFLIPFLKKLVNYITIQLSNFGKNSIKEDKVINNLENYRSLNFEIIRIIAMLLITFHHAVLYSNLKPVGINYYIFDFFKNGGKLGVILFVLITGYFEVDKEFRWQKLLKIFCHTFFYSYLFLIIFAFINSNIKFPILRKSLFPITDIHYWFITSYIILYLLIPFLNQLIKNLEQTKFKRLLVILTLFICGIPSITFSNFQIGNLGVVIYIYFIGAYIKKYEIFEKIKARNCLSISIFIYIIAYIFNILAYKYIPIYFGNFFSLNSILMYLSAILIFKYFKNFKIDKFNKTILFFSKTTLGVYLIHENLFMSSYLWESQFEKVVQLSNLNYSIVLILYVVLVYLFCSICDYIYLKFIEKYLIKKFEKIFSMLKNLLLKLNKIRIYN